jgi:hypothetical protein
MSEEEVLNIVIQVLEVVLKKHEENGRHEINRSDLGAAIAQLKAVGLSAAKPEIQKLF